MDVIEKFIMAEENICFLEECTLTDAISILVQSMSGSIDGRVDDVIEKIQKREKIMPTAIGKSIAIPHGRCEFLDNFHIALGICTIGGVQWEAVDEQDVKIICLIAGPEDKPREYLSFLSFITSLLKEEELRLRILNESNKKNIVNIFRSC